jgi:putative transposase
VPIIAVLRGTDAGFGSVPGYYAAKTRRASARTQRDTRLKDVIARVHADNHGVYGVRRTWAGFAYLALVVDVFSRRIVGWALTTHLRTALPLETLETLEMAIWDRNERQRRPLDGLIHHSDAGSQYTAIRYTDTLAGVGALPSIGSVGDSYDNALAESTIGQIKTELVHRRGPWRTVDQLEYALFEYLDWWNHRRLHGEIGMRTPAETEAAHYAQPPALTEASNQ